MASSPSSVLSPAAPEVLIGSPPPRLFTPPAVELTPQTSLGFALIEFATDVLGLELLPWQKWLALHALELRPDSTFRFRTVLVLVGRQSGKSTFLQVLSLFFLYVRGVALVIGTAQSLDIAEEVWQGAVDMAQGAPELASEIERIVLVNGKKALELRRGERYKVQSANRRGGRGLSGDLVMLDELREHQSWDAWSAVTKTTMARSHAQVWAASNAGDRHSIVLHYLRQLAHQALGDPDGICETPSHPDADVESTSLGIFEWSAAPGCALDDPQGWSAATPSLGHTITERAIRAAMQTDPEAVFRTEVLCQWVVEMRQPAIDPDSWARLADPDVERGTQPVFAVATAADRSWTAIAVAWKRTDGLPHVMLADYRPQTAWVPARLEELLARWGGAVTVDTPCRGLVPNALEPSQAEQAQAHNALSDAVGAAAVRHSNDSALNVAVKSATWRPSGDSRVLDRSGSLDIAPLIAAALAVHSVSANVIDVSLAVW